jgi:glutathione synthase
MMIVQPGENNLFDQRWIEQTLFEQHGVKLIRRSLAQVQKQGHLSTQGKKLVVDGLEVSVVYFRAGYTPNDYPSEQEWQARSLIESSYAVKCPNAAYHLVGAKKVQQVLAEPGRLERFMSTDDATLLRKSFTGLYPMDQSPEGIKAYNMALKDPSRYVLKPQREGGGNNYYGEEIKEQLTKLSLEERNGFILMDLIKPPPLKNIMIRKGKAINSDVISELGIYGIWVSKGNVCMLNECGGHLLRTKSSQSNEGGVAAGFAVLDSPLLIDSQ